MKILVCNDDGINSKGLTTLVSALSEIGDVYVMAPEGERSGNSQHITILGKVKIENRYVEKAKEAYACWGTPCDCVRLALRYLYKNQIDLVVSGINHGMNASNDIIYSATCAIAREAFMNNVKAIAVSIDSFVDTDFTYAAEFAKNIAEKFVNEQISKECFLNVNVPNLPEDKIKGVKICGVGPRIAYKDVYKTEETADGKYIHITAESINDNPGLGDLNVDHDAVRAGYVSICALDCSYVNKDCNKVLKKKLENCK